MKQSKSSKRWLQEHFADIYVKKAQAEGYRSRAVYKLQELDEKERIIHPGMCIIDLGAAPGGWTQYCAKKMKGKGKVIALDLLPMEPIPMAEFIEGDFTEEAIYQKLLSMVSGREVDLVLSDMAPNMSGTAAVDIPRAMHLAELAHDFAQSILKPGGSFIIKLFHGEGFDAFVQLVRSQFNRVVIKKPMASRPRSREVYLFAKDFKQHYTRNP